MFDVGWTELVVIGVVALIVIGPKDLPEMFRTLGRVTGKLRAMARDFQRVMEQAANESGVKDVAKDLKAVTSPKSLGIDAVKDAAARFEKWDPLKPAKQAAAKPAAPVAAAAPVATAEAATPADDARPMGPATRALYEAKTSKRAAKPALAAEAPAKAPAKTRTPAKAREKAGAKAPAKAAVKPAVKAAPAAAKAPAKPRAPRKPKPEDAA